MGGCRVSLINDIMKLLVIIPLWLIRDIESYQEGLALARLLPAWTVS